MLRLFRFKYAWSGISSNRLRASQSRRPLCSSTKPNNNGDEEVNDRLSRYHETYQKLDNLDFMTAAKIVFTAPPDKTKFGLDFHLVQLFFVCMPSLAVYLVAQYARYEMRRMEAELEVKKKAEDEAKAKELELKAAEEKESVFDPELQGVKARLHELEEAVKEIAIIASKRQPESTITQKQDGNERKQAAATALEGSNSASEELASKGTTKGSGQSDSSGSMPVTDMSQRKHKGTQDKSP